MNRLKSIDFLRGVAVILVLFRHHKFFDPLQKAGWIGVDLFFVLSGYLVSSLLFKEYQKTQKIAPLRFLARRGFKIYPLFYLAIAITTLLEISFGGESFKLSTLFSEVFFVQNYFAGMWSHTWSLAVEEHFYLAIALFVFVVSRSKIIENRAFMIRAFVSLMLLALILRLNNLQYPYTPRSHLFPTHLRYDSLLFGVLLSYLHHFKKENFESFLIKRQSILLIISIIFLIPAFIFSDNSNYINTIGLTQFYIGFGLLLAISIVNSKSYSYIQKVIGRKLSDLTALIGFYSYGIYLFHMFSIRYGLGLFHKFGIAFHYRIEFVFYFIVSIVFGILVSRLVEQPLLKYRDKLIPRNTYKKQEVQ